MENDQLVFYVLDDKLEPRSLYHAIELRDSTPLAQAVIEALWQVVARRPSIGIGIGVPGKRYFYIAADGIWFLGAETVMPRGLDDALKLPVVIQEGS